MKNLYYLLACLFFIAACSKDNGTGDIETFVPSDVYFVDTLYNELENTGKVEIGIQLATPATGDFSIEVIAALENNMTGGKDYVLDQLCPVKKGEKEAVLYLELIDNRVADPGRFLELRIMDATGGKILEPSMCRFNVIDDESQCAVIFQHKEISGYEGEDLRVPICLSGTMSGNVNFKVEQIGGTAVEGSDYVWGEIPEFTLETLTDTAYLLIHPIDDALSSPDRTLILEITEVEGADIVTSRSNCLVNIGDNDVTLGFAEEKYGVAETDKLFLLPICLSQPIQEDVEVKVAVMSATNATEGVDFTVEKNVTIPAGQDSVRLVLRPQDIDGISEDKEVVLKIEECSSPYVQVDGKECHVTIWDCDSPLSVLKAESLMTDDVLTVEVGMEQVLTHDVYFKLRGDAEGLPELSEQYLLPAGETKVQVQLPVEGVITLLENVDLYLYDVYGASQGNALPIEIIYPLDQSNWSIAKYSSEDTNNENFARDLIDGSETTYWHNQYIFPKPSLPVEIVVDLGKPCILTDMNLVRRLNNADTRKVEMYITNATVLDDAEWIFVTTLNYSDDVNDSYRKLHWDEGLTTQFVRLKVVDAESNMVSLAELILYGR